MFFTPLRANIRLRPTHTIAYVDPVYCRCRPSTDHHLQRLVICVPVFFSIILSARGEDSVVFPIHNCCRHGFQRPRKIWRFKFDEIQSKFWKIFFAFWTTFVRLITAHA